MLEITIYFSILRILLKLIKKNINVILILKNTEKY